MNEAYTIAMKSNCISRQVGAVVIGPKGYIVGAGWNDVGRGLISCGLRAIADLGDVWCQNLATAINPSGQAPEQLAASVAKEYGPGLSEDQAKQCWFCFKDLMANRLQRPKLLESFRRGVDALQCDPEKKAELQGLLRELLNGVLDDVKIHQLEFCLALHAEENAILQGARIGGMGLRGGKIYTTAQPCTLCSKKIHQVGLKEVIYTEPYPKSLPELYMPGVSLRQFDGVKPRAYIRLFMPHHDRKDWQELAVRGLLPNI
jgi:dCMP deaminase